MADPGDLLEGGSALRFDDGQFFAALQDDYCLPVASHPPELDRLDHLHQVYKALIGNVPTELDQTLQRGVPFRVLDIGCGTGIWALEVALAYPGTQVTAIDLVPCPLPRYPKNLSQVELSFPGATRILNESCSFEIRDIVKTVPYPDESFDVIHICDIKKGIHDYRHLLAECARCLRPGGWLLVIEPDADPSLMLEDTDDIQRYLGSLATFLETMNRALSERGVNPYVGRELGDYARQDSRLESVTHERVVVPWNDWSDDPILKYAGRHARQALDAFSRSVRILLADHGVADPDRLGEQALAAVDQEGIQPTWAFYHLVARKRLP